MSRPSRGNTGGRAYLELRARARREGRPTDELLVLYVLERFLYRLSISDYRSRLVLKGGMLLAAFDERRPTADVDLLAQAISNNVEVISDVVRDVLTIKVDDGVTFEPEGLRAQVIRDADPYTGARITVPARVDRARHPLRIDINVGDPVTPAPVHVTYPALLAEPFELVGYPLETILAEKIVTMIDRGDATTRSDGHRNWHRTGFFMSVSCQRGDQAQSGDVLEYGVMGNERHARKALCSGDPSIGLMSLLADPWPMTAQSRVPKVMSPVQGPLRRARGRTSAITSWRSPTYDSTRLGPGHTTSALANWTSSFLQTGGGPEVFRPVAPGEGPRRRGALPAHALSPSPGLAARTPPSCAGRANTVAQRTGKDMSLLKVTGAGSTTRPTAAAGPRS